MGVFTREEEELRLYDADAFFYFAGTLLLLILLPWTYALVSTLRNPKPTPEVDYDARGNAPNEATIRRCGTTAMEAKRQIEIEVARLWPVRLRRGGAGLQIAGIIVLWCCLVAVICRIMVTPVKLNGFDPYEILDISSDSTISQIKKAFRAKSLAHHPDKDRDNPLAPALFQQVKKAYDSLTDEGARKNFQKYGNPDGPGRMKVGIALHPAILGSKDRQLAFICFFFFIILSVPMSIVFCCLRTKNITSGGLAHETLRTFSAIIDDEIGVEDGLGLIAASMEARSCGAGPRQLAAAPPGGHEESMKRLLEALAAERPRPLRSGLLVQVVGSGHKYQGRRGVVRKQVSDSPLHSLWSPQQKSELSCSVEVWPKDGSVPTGVEQVEMQDIVGKDLQAVEPWVACPFNDPPIRRITALLWAHLWRKHEHLAPEYEAELRQILLCSVKVGRALVSIAAQAMGDRSGNIDIVRGLINTRRCLVQALDLKADPLLQIPHVTKSALEAQGASLPTLQEVVNLDSGALETLLTRLKFTPEQRLDAGAFCRHAPRLQVSAEAEIPDEKEISDSDFACLTVTIVRSNLNEGEAVGPAHAPLFPGPKFEELWVLLHDDRARRLVTVEAVLGTGRTETSKIRFLVPRHGEFRWSIHVLSDSYLGLDVQCPITFTALKRRQVNRDIFIHPADMHIKSLFEELMEGLQAPEEEESESEDELPSSKPVAKAAAKPLAEPQAAPELADVPPQPAPPQAQQADSDDDSDSEEVPEGTFHRIVGQQAPLFRQPQEGDENQDQPFGQLPAGMFVRGFLGEWRPDGWLELAPGGAWIRTGEGRTEAFGSLMEQHLRTVVQTPTPVSMVRRWMKGTSREIELEDVLQVQDMSESRVRTKIEELARDKLGDESFNSLLDQAQARRDATRRRLGRALGVFCSQNGCLWRITPAGQVRGVHPDGSRIRDKIEAGPSKEHDNQDVVRIGPFRLDEKRTCSCLHWLKADDPTGEKAWVWRKDDSLRTRVQLGSAFT